MQLLVIATGSTGNCYALQDERGAVLLLDAGINAKKILAGIDYRLRDVVGCLITHEHMDHCAGVERLSELGIHCYGTAGTKQVVPCLHSNGNRPILLGVFLAMPFPVVHDAADPCGWLITNQRTGERMVYITDTCAMRYTFPNLDYWLIECNYMDELLDEDTPEIVRNRLGKSHMSLNRLCTVLQANDLSTCKQIILCHASRRRLDPDIAQETISRLTGKQTMVARAKLSIDLTLEPF